MFPGRYAFKARLKSDCRLTLRAMRKHRVHYLFMLPYLLLFSLFTILPVIVAVLLSFTSFNMLSAPEFIGVDNYFRLFLNDDVFIIALKNTLLFAVIVGPGGFLLSFFFAWLINELSHNMRVFFTIIFYAPSISGGIYIIWNYLFSGDAQGYVNSILRKLGIIQTPIQFFQNPDYMFPILIVIILWMSLGTSFLVFIAGFQGVDKQYYEAAALDGISNRWQELWYVTLPMMKPQLLLSAVLSITGSFGVGDVITNLCGFPSTNYAVHTIMNHLSDYGTTRYEMGYACTLATILFLMMIFCNSVIRKLLKSVGT